jgi:hypothetical protein
MRTNVRHAGDAGANTTGNVIVRILFSAARATPCPAPRAGQWPSGLFAKYGISVTRADRVLADYLRSIKQPAGDFAGA